MFRNMARRPIEKTETYLKYGFVITEHKSHYCPKCGSVLNAGPNYIPNYCSRCGQKINFSGAVWTNDKELGFVRKERIL